jgi:hypothetical protein
MSATIIKWPDFETWIAWITPRRKRLGKPTERGTVLWFPRVHPIYATRAAAYAASASASAATAKAAQKACGKRATKLKPTKSVYLQKMRETNYGRGK